ncbi:MAG TPA: hypothetical protein DIW31_12180 [Bacteroidales bacterium]|nr:hypothetical protein [Bacteroidales bacterium]
MVKYKQSKLSGIASKLILIALLFPFVSKSNEPEKSPGARAAGVGSSTIALADPWSIFNNQAGLGHQRNYWAGVYHEKRYFLNELSFSSFGSCIPVKPGTFGIGVTHFGYSQFSQSKFGISYGMMLSKNISAGIGINYHSVKIVNGYGSAGCITAEGGIIYKPIEKISIGAHVYNPTQSSFGDNQNLPTTFGLGIAYQPTESVLILVQGDDNTLTSPTFRTGLEYSPVKKLSFRAGLISNPMSLSFGLGWNVKNLNVDLAFSYHQVLGYTPYISLAYTFGGGAKNQGKPEQ